eukprot:358065-Chlamydomonas_euryale.AAC.8
MASHVRLLNGCRHGCMAACRVARFVCTSKSVQYVRTVRTFVGGKVHVCSTLSVFEPSLHTSCNSHNSMHTAWISIFKLCCKAECKRYQAGKKSIESRLLGAFCMGHHAIAWTALSRMGCMVVNGAAWAAWSRMKCKELHGTA